MPSDAESHHSSFGAIPSQNQWLSCLSASLEIGSIARTLPPDMVVKLTPTASSTFYLAGLVIAMHQVGTEKEEDRQRFQIEAGFLLIILSRAGSHWHIAHNFYVSLKSILSELSMSGSFLDLISILKCWRGPFSTARLLPPVLSQSHLQGTSAQAIIAT
ncbi:hypothetical protein FE257_007155 [Aspergillus nanangensis]|uniref:Uncharacterized protein n=1 Tax=Aspergillus nanangensis TaxID=2582783 RepID=A0AAD4GUE1_ASPNN|nr:hypothetical protein FE257_007155 [Aspergillus nanangensis]